MTFKGQNPLKKHGEDEPVTVSTQRWRLTVKETFFCINKT
jgi:hypothetical protein